VLGCTSPARPAASSAHTLTGNPRFPATDMARFFTPDKWQKLQEITYAGYVIMQAQIKADGTVILGREIEAYPDSSWSALARALGQQARLHAATGGYLDAKAQIYVVFFPSGWDGNVALIFGQQESSMNPTLTQRATCLTTTRY
jgi:hypothetical protein